jgi:glycine betaine catabolism B
MKRREVIFSTFQIADIINRSNNISSFRFKRPDDFQYLPGQYIIVQLRINHQLVQKAFSLSSSPTEQEFIEFTKKFTGHEFSEGLKALQVGDFLNLDGPFGSFTLKEDDNKIAMLAGGIGVTPFRSMIQYSMDKGIDNDIVMICSNKTEDDIIFKDDFQEMMKQHPNFSIVLTCTRPTDNWTGICGRIDRNMIEREVPDFRERMFYICGPPVMVESMKELLRSMDIPDNMILFEDFFGY